MITYKALLLTILVAGVVTITGNAYAQSNTDRLINIDEATEDILEAVGGIPELLGSIQDSITELMEAVTALSSDVTGLSSNMTGIHSNVAGIYSEINNLSASSAASSLRIESTISTIEPTLLGIAAGVENNRNTLESLSSIMASMNANIESIESSLGAEEDDGGLARSIEFLTSTINRNEISVSERLDKIEAALEGLSTKPPTTQSTSIDNVSPGSEAYDVTSYTYQSQGDKKSVFGQDVYKLEFTFSCDKPVTIDTVSTDLTQRVSWIITDPTPDSRTNENYLKVENRELYHSKFALQAGSYQVYNRAVDFNYLRSLPVGDALIFESQQYDLNNKIRDAERTVSDGYTITVEYLGDRSTVCSFSGSGGSGGSGTTPSGPLSNSQTLTLTPDVDTSGSLLHTFSVDITCDDDPVEITNIEAAAVNGWNTALTNFAEFELAIGAETVSIPFENDGELGDYDYPISFSEDITISGELPGAAQILIEVSYNTVSDGSCEES